MLTYASDKPVSVSEFRDLLQRSSLAARRPVDDAKCLSGMIEHSNLIVSCWDEARLVGIARSVTDFHYCCYLSDLAVDEKHQRRGIGRRLIQLTQEASGPRCQLILLSAPAAVEYYPHLGFEKHPQCWVLPPEKNVVDLAPDPFLTIMGCDLYDPKPMRKRLISNSLTSPPTEGALQPRVDVERLARVEITSEDPAYPIEAALQTPPAGGWRAGAPGEQRIRLVFDSPVKLQRIRLSFCEREIERTQEFALRWSSNQDEPLLEILRQQYHFSPGGSIQEVEDYSVELDGVTVLELNILPDIQGGQARASLMSFELA